MSKLWWVRLLIVAVPIIIGFSWGLHFQEDVYLTLRYARDLAPDRGTDLGSLPNILFSTLPHPLLALLLSFPARWGIDLIPIAALISLFGWSAAALTVLNIGGIVKSPLGGMVASLLLIFNPWIIATLGEITSWQIALFWIIIASILHRRFVIVLLWTAMLFLTLISFPVANAIDQLAQTFAPLLWSGFVVVAGIGADRLHNKLVERDLIRLTPHQTQIGLLFITFLVLGVYQVRRLQQLYQLRPLAVWQVEREISEWINSSTAKSATLFASEKVGYMAQREVVGSLLQRQSAVSDNNLQVIQDLQPDYLISDNSLIWQYITSSNWFQLSYQSHERFHASENLITYGIWEHRLPLESLEPRQAINARIPDRLKLLGYQVGPGAIQPGETLELALYLQVPEVISSPTEKFSVIVRLVSPIDNAELAGWTVELEQSQDSNLWQPDEVIVEQLLMPLPNDLVPGAYHLNISFRGANDSQFWPISLDNDMNQLDRVALGTVLIPPPLNMKAAQPVNVQFGSQAYLVGYELKRDASNPALEIVLYWQTSAPIDEELTVFTHFFDAAGNLIAGHDSPPADGRFPTTSWRKGVIIPDTHQIHIPLDLPSGEYSIAAGLYSSATGERLEILDDNGNPISSSVTIEKIEIP
ncbi:MAG: hypothetical protein R3293_24730 [Candidatus Promineifilaceae bacterium]|nr:hypothetical protein [Candidatus Promineifilaceae bacterium]